MSNWLRLAVRERERLKHRAQDREHLGRRYELFAARFEKIREALSVDPLQGHPGHLAAVSRTRHAEVEHLHDLRVRELRDGARLLREAREKEPLVLGSESVWDEHHLERDRPLEREVKATVHDAEAALRHDALDREASLQRGANDREGILRRVRYRAHQTTAASTRSIPAPRRSRSTPRGSATLRRS